MTDELKNFTLTSIQNIQNAIENNKLIVFIGAGVSKNSGIPTWNELIKELAKDLGINAKTHNDEGFDRYGVDDYLKIPEYYFNEREHREYISKIRSILDIETQPNELHDIIFDLKPVHIITTNYDTLLEDEYNIKNTPIKYFKVANNEELAAAPISNYIIKMHGEFENIVLKESDYDSYSQNFTLLETYIKGLFATHTILFIGFSATDSNVRKIRQWVKNIVGNKFQPTYLIDVNDYDDFSREEFRIRHEYYKKQGIFTLYKKQIEKEINTVFESCKKKISLTGQGFELYKFIYFIINYKNFSINKYYNILKQLEPLNVITPEILNKVFNTKIPERLTENRKILNETEQETFELDTLRLKIALVCNNKDDIVKLLYKNTVLPKIYLNNINLLAKQILQPPFQKSERWEPQLDELITKLQQDVSFDAEEKIKTEYVYKIIISALNSASQIEEFNFIKYEQIKPNLSNTSSVRILSKAFNFYNNHKYVDSYRELNRITKEQRQNSIIYYIAEFNKKTIIMNLKLEKIDKKLTEEEQSIIKDYDKINLEQIINHKMSDSIKPIVKLFTIENIEKTYMEIVDLSEKIVSYKRLIENGGSGFNSYYRDLQQKLYSFFNLTYNNYLFIGKYKQTSDVFYQIIKAMLVSYTTKESENKPFMNFGISKQGHFSYFDLFIIINYVSYKDFTQLLQNLSIENLDVSIDAKKEVLAAFKNYLDYMKNSFDLSMKDKIANFLTILRLIKINIDEFREIINIYTNFVNIYVTCSKTIDGHNFRGYLHEILSAFILKNSQRFLEQKIKLPKDLYEQIIENYRNIWTMSSDQYNKLIEICIFALKTDKKYSLKNQIIIDFYIDEFYKGSKNTDELLAKFYILADKEHKSKIRGIFKRQEYKAITANNCCAIYYALINNVIRHTKTIDNQWVTFANTTLSNNKPNESYPETILKILGIIRDLIILDKFKNLKKITEIIDNLNKIQFRNEYNQQQLEIFIRLLKIYIDPINFNYSNAKISDFRFLNDYMINQIKTKQDNLIKIARLLIYSNSDRIKEVLLKENLNKIFE